MSGLKKVFRQAPSIINTRELLIVTIYYLGASNKRSIMYLGEDPKVLRGSGTLKSHVSLAYLRSCLTMSEMTEWVWPKEEDRTRRKEEENTMR